MLFSTIPGKSARTRSSLMTLTTFVLKAALLELNMTVGRALSGFRPIIHRWKLIVCELSSSESRCSLLRLRVSSIARKIFCSKSSKAGPLASQIVLILVPATFLPIDACGFSHLGLLFEFIESWPLAATSSDHQSRLLTVGWVVFELEN